MRLRTRVRLHILTGFLGSGKSTLLRRYLFAGPDRSNVAILINEFGSVAIDHTLVRAVSPHAQALAGGCACCTVDQALTRALIDILTQVESGNVPNITDIVLETSGMADPSRIIGTIAGDMNLAEYVEIANCITVVEVGTDAALIERFPEIRNQIVCASRLVLTKVDMHSASEAAKTTSLLAEINPFAVILATSNENEGNEDFFAQSTGPRATAPLPSTHQLRLRTFEVDLGPNVGWPAFSVWLTALIAQHGHSILRFKGVIPLASPDHALVLQSVRHRVSEPEHLELAPGDRQKSFGLVFICDGAYEAPVHESLMKFRKICERLDVEGTK